MLSQTVEYSLRAVVYLAMNSNSPVTNSKIAIATKVPAAYLAKVLRELGKAKIISSQRGVNGGVRLIKEIEHLSILEIVNAVEPIRRIKTCPLEISTHGIKLCALHAKIDHALSQFEEAFRSTTVSDLLAEDNSSKPLCENSKRMTLNIRNKK